MDKIDMVINGVTKHYQTRLSFQLCKKMNINVVSLDLPKTMNSFYKDMKQPCYHHEFDTPKGKTFFICAYKLEHILLHNGVKLISLINFLNVSNQSEKRRNRLFYSFT